MRQLLLFIALIASQLASAQFTYTLISSPDSALVTLNGEEQCYTPCKVKYYWRDRQNDQIKFNIIKENFDTWEEIITEKPSYFDKFSRVYLEKDYKNLNLDNSPIIAFDKLRVDFENGKKVGQEVPLKGETVDIKWSGSIKVGDEGFEKTFYKVATNMGFNTPASENSKLFSEEKRSRKLPKYIIGVEIEDYFIEYKEQKKSSYGAGKRRGLTKIKFGWQVLDKKSNRVVLSEENEMSLTYRLSKYETEQNNLDVFELSLIDFLSSDAFVKLLEEGDVQYEPLLDTTVAEEHLIPLVEISKTENFSDLVREANSSCVTIITDGGHGSGVIISESGLLLSAYHVVEGVNQIDVKLPSGITLQAEIVQFDENSDVVLLDIKGEGFTALPLSKTNSFPLGAEVFTIGTPADLDLGQTISKGILSGKRKRDNQIFLQIDMSISPGNSGGPLINNKGEVIGIVQSKIIGEGVEGIGFAYPIDQVIKDLNLILK